MANFLKYTLSKEDKTPTKQEQARTYRTANMYNITSNKSYSRWNLDEVLDVHLEATYKTCSTVEVLSDFDKTVLRILYSKYVSDKILTDVRITQKYDLFEFMVELMNNEYRNGELGQSPTVLKKKQEGIPQIMKKYEVIILKELSKTIGKLLKTNLFQLKNFVSLFNEKLTRLIKTVEKSCKKYGLVEFDKLAQAFQKKQSPIKTTKEPEVLPESMTKKYYLEHKENKLKKIKDKSKQSLGTMGSRYNNSDSHQNLSSKKGSVEEGGSLYKLLNREGQGRQIKRYNYDYSAIMSGSMNIRKRINTEDSSSRYISSVEPKLYKYQIFYSRSNKNNAFVFFRPQKGQLPPKRN